MPNNYIHRTLSVILPNRYGGKQCLKEITCSNWYGGKQCMEETTSSNSYGGKQCMEETTRTDIYITNITRPNWIHIAWYNRVTIKLEPTVSKHVM